MCLPSPDVSCPACLNFPLALQCVVLMDEISTGLDSATAYSVLRTFRDVAHSLDRTMLISLLQVGGPWGGWGLTLVHVRGAICRGL